MCVLFTRRNELYLLCVQPLRVIDLHLHNEKTRTQSFLSHLSSLRMRSSAVSGADECINDNDGASRRNLNVTQHLLLVLALALLFMHPYPADKDREAIAVEVASSRCDTKHVHGSNRVWAWPTLMDVQHEVIWTPKIVTHP